MNGRKNHHRLIAAPIAAIAMLLGSPIITGVGVAQALLITEEEHWKYRIDRWLWDEDRRRTYGLTTPQIVIQNETADQLEGIIADANGTRLEFYDGDQVVSVRYLSNNSANSSWEIAGRVHDGYFAIDIPQKYREAEIVKIFIGTNQYIVDNGTPTTPQTQVFFNSAIATYTTNSALDQLETQVAQSTVALESEEETGSISSAYEGGSLIDWILNRNGLLPVRSSDSGE